MAKLKHRFKDFDELSIYLKSKLKEKYLTVYVDSFFLDRRRLSEIISLAVKEAKKIGKAYHHYDSMDNIKKHIEYRRKKGYIYEWEGDPKDPYVQIVGYENQKVSQKHPKETFIDRQNNESAYLPTKHDCESAVMALTGAKDVIDGQDVLNYLESHFDRRSITLKENWKMITIKNFKIWFR